MFSKWWLEEDECKRKKRMSDLEAEEINLHSITSNGTGQVDVSRAKVKE